LAIANPVQNLANEREIPSFPLAANGFLFFDDISSRRCELGVLAV
jgi:hypothetical protein